MNINDYKIIKCENQYDLEREVKSSMKMFWQPFGGITVMQLPTSFGLQTSWAQAMVKYY